jgi:glycosyltransferase involved in cell wall biosynthesis
VDVFCSPSQFLIDKHKEAGFTGRTQLVRNGIPLPSVRQKPFAPDAARRFLFAARLTVEKGCEVVLEAVRRMPADADFILQVAGKGPFADAFASLAASDARVQFLGYIQNDAKTEAFAAADCLLLPSLWYENAPVVIVEAAAYGIGVIGSDIGAIPEFVTQEKTGLLFAPGNPDALAASMLRLIREPQLLPQFRENAKALVAVSGVDTMVDAYLAQYATLWRK